MSPQKTRTATQQIAFLLRDEARRLGLSEAKMCEMAGVSASYLSKAKSGTLRDISQENIQALSGVVDLSPAMIYERLGLPEPIWMNSTVGTTLFTDEDPIQLRFPYIETVPDHIWPLLARDIFRNFNIELIEEPLSLTEFKSRMFHVEEGKADTLVVILAEWLTQEEYASKLKPVTPSHFYHGYALIGRRDGGGTRGLDSSDATAACGPTLANLFALIADLRYDDVIGEGENKGTIAFCDTTAQQFVNQLVLVAQADKKTKGMFDNLEINKDAPIVPASTLTFLEPLLGRGTSRIDFVVGHALTVATALALRAEYRIFANFKHLEQVVEQLETGLNKDNRRDEVANLRNPVVVALNSPNGLRNGDNLDRKLMRICGAVNAASDSLLKNLSPRSLRELEDTLGKRVRTNIEGRELREAWNTSYTFMTAAEWIVHLKRICDSNVTTQSDPILRLLADSYNNMKRFVALKPLSVTALDACKDDRKILAKRHFDNGNFFDACRILDALPERGTSNQ